MIYCVYLNPTIDKTLYLDRLCVGGTNRPNRIVINGAGKAINVAVVLSELNVRAKVIGIVNQTDREIKERLQNAGIAYDFLELPGQTRVNTKIFDEEMSIITELNESGSEISPENIGRIVRKIIEGLAEGDIAVLTGSIPAGCGKQVYADLIAALNKKKVKCVLDADGEALLRGVEEKPYMIKPNIEEMSALLGYRVGEEKEELIEAGRMLLEKGISVVGISLGAKGAVLMDKEKVLFAQAEKVKVKSTVGAGDSMVAGMISRFDKDLEAMLRAGVAAATGSVTQEGTNLCTAELFSKYYSGIQINNLGGAQGGS